MDNSGVIENAIAQAIMNIQKNGTLEKVSSDYGDTATKEQIKAYEKEINGIISGNGLNIRQPTMDDILKILNAQKT